MGIKVAKFGGSSLADAAHFKKVREILLADEDRRIVVPSAPGKRSSVDVKITDMLYQCNRLACAGKDRESEDLLFRHWSRMNCSLGLSE